MTSVNNKLVAVLKKWPATPNRSSRDYAFHLRQCVEESPGKPFQGTTDENFKKLESLQRIAENKYYNLYSYNFKVGATGLPIKVLNIALDDKSIDNFNKLKIKST